MNPQTHLENFSRDDLVASSPFTHYEELDGKCEDQRHQHAEKNNSGTYSPRTEERRKQVKHKQMKKGRNLKSLGGKAAKKINLTVVFFQTLMAVMCLKTAIFGFKLDFCLYTSGSIEQFYSTSPVRRYEVVEQRKFVFLPQLRLISGCLVQTEAVNPAETNCEGLDGKCGAQTEAKVEITMERTVKKNRQKKGINGTERSFF